MKYKYILVLMILVCITALAAKYSDDFPIGVYSYMRNGGAYFDKHNPSLAALQKELGYNCSIINTSNIDKNLDGLLEMLDSNQLDAIVIDNAWSNDPNDSRSGSVVGISMGNYYRFEAEFSDSSSVVPGDGANNLYWYGTLRAKNNLNTPSRVGKVSADASASYGNVWLCDKTKDKPGYAYTDITYRWQDSKGLANKLAREVRVFKTNPDAGRATDSLRVTFRVKIAKLEQRANLNQVLLSYQPLGYLGNEPQFADSIVVAHAKGEAFGKFTMRDFFAKGSPKGYFDITFALGYPELIASGIMTDDLDNNPNTEASEWSYFMNSLLTRLYWHGEYDLLLDYVEIEDQMHYDLRTNKTVFKDRINRRLRELVTLPHGDAISHIYCIDEPFQTQLSSFAAIQELIDPELPPVMTASYDIRFKQYLMSDNHSYWDMVDVVRKQAKPKYLMPDMYPIKPWISYTPGEKDFIQDVIDFQVLRVYRESKLYTLEQAGRKFYPTVQTFGKWDGKYWVTWMMPAKATQKALLFLPLCYAPDGIFSFYLTSVINEKTGIGDYGPIPAIGGKTLNIDNHLFEVIKEVNPQLEYYGKILKQWKWMGAYTVMTENPKLPEYFMANGIADIKVEKSGIGSYEGFVECGFYKDDSDNIALFAVNRRTDEFTGSKADNMKYPYQVAPNMYQERYTQYPPQQLLLDFVPKLRVAFPALYNPLTKTLWTSKGNTARISLDAGDGLMLQVVESMPDKLKKGSYILKKDAIISGNISVEKKAVVVCKGDLTLLPGTTLTLKKGSTLRVEGKLIISDGAKLNSNGNLELN